MIQQNKERSGQKRTTLEEKIRGHDDADFGRGCKKGEMGKRKYGWLGDGHSSKKKFSKAVQITTLTLTLRTREGARSMTASRRGQKVPRLTNMGINATQKEGRKERDRKKRTAPRRTSSQGTQVQAAGLILKIEDEGRGENLEKKKS